MTLADLPVIGQLEKLCFPAPWTIDTYRNELLHNRYSCYWVLRPLPDGPAAAAPILAYGGYWLMSDEAHIVTIAAHPDFRRQGLGESLLVGIIAKTAEQGAALVTLEVRITNTAAQALYDKLGFVRVGLRRKYYNDNGEDAILMTLFLDPSRTER